MGNILNRILRTLTKQWKGILGYLIFIIATLVFFLYVTFPWDLLKERLLYEMSRQSSYAFKVQDSSPLFPAGLRLSGLQISDPMKPDDKPLTRIDRLTLRVSPSDFLWGRLTSSFEAEAFGGQVLGTFGESSRKKELDAEWKKVDLVPLKDFGKLPVTLAGTLSGKGHWTASPQGTTGSLRMTVEKGRIKDLNVKGFPLPELIFDTIQGAADVKGNVLTLKEVKLRGDDLKGTIKGEITFEKPGASSTLNLQFRLHLSDRARAPYQGFLSMVEKSRDKEGYYNFSLKGTFKEPQVSL